MAKAPSKFSGGLKRKTKSGGAAPSSGGRAASRVAASESSTRRRGGHKKIGQVLVDLGFINEEQLWQVIEHHQQTNELTGQCAVQMQFITKEMLMQALAEQQGMRTINLRETKIEDGALKDVSREMCDLYKIIPVEKNGNVLTIALSDPTNIAALDDLRNLLSVDDVQAVVADESDILELIEQKYAGSGESIEDIIKQMQSEDDEFEDGGLGGSIDIGALEAEADSAPVRKLLNMVLLMAIRDKASDIHLEPFEDEFRMRYRVDGVMYELVPPPRHLAPAMASRVKVMANLDIAERRVPQDGRIELNIGGNPVDLRVSVLPTLFGEAVVMRVLDRTVVNLDMQNLGMPPKLLQDFRDLMDKPNGIVLVTGPTGSGKTTTLYSALNEMNEVEVKIITTEDPIEYDIEGLVQVPINHDIDVTFARALRSILRQDPDIILVGEIRDYETAEIAIQASLTGHLVFSTLHTNDAPGAITRLRDMGVPAFMITATVEGVLAQRLVRKICSNCREPYTPSPEIAMELGLKPEQVEGRQFYHGRGCEVCNNSGHKGRTGIHELLIVDDEVRQLIMDGANKDQITAAGRRLGMQTLRESGIRAVFEGVSTVEEIVRETFSDEDG